MCIFSFRVVLGSPTLVGRDVEIEKYFEEAVDATIRWFIILCNTWKTMRFFSIGTEGNIKDSLKTIEELVFKVIRIRWKELLQNDENVERRDMLLNVIILHGDGTCLFSDEMI